MLVRVMSCHRPVFISYIAHITANEVLIYFCMKLCQVSRTRSVKNVTGRVYMGDIWAELSDGQGVSRVSIRGMDPTVWYSPPYRQILWWGFWASACGSPFSWSLPSFKSPPHRAEKLFKLRWESLFEDMQVGISLLLRQVFGTLMIVLPEETEQDSSLILNSLLPCVFPQCSEPVSFPVLCLLFPFISDTHLKKPAVYRHRNCLSW